MARLSFTWAENSTELLTEDHRLRDALALIYGAFLDPASGLSETPQVHAPTLSACLGGEQQSFETLGQAVLELEDALGISLLDGCPHLMLHAAALTNGKQTVIVLGQSGSGKTTMSLELVKRGYRFLADEYTVMDANAPCLHPFPRSTVVKNVVSAFPPGASYELETDLGPRVFHLPEDKAPLCPHTLDEIRLIFPRYEQDAATQLEPLSTTETCSRLMLGSFNFEHNEADLWPALSHLATRAKSCQVSYDKVEDGLDAALQLFDE